MTESQYLTALTAFNYFGPVRVKLLISYFKSARNIWNSKTEELISTGLPTQRVLEFDKFRTNFEPKDYFNRLEKLKINVLTIFDSGYPKNLKGLEGAPLVLYFKGNIKNSGNSVAIVGSRKMTSYGKGVAEKFSSELAKLGIIIISGLARGIDTTAHKAALKTGGRTFAVLGGGLDSIYPPENSDLAKEIVDSGGALISEYPLGYPLQPVNFAVRNRIISGMSKAVVVIEGAEKSGTLLTATHAAEQGKTVFAVPGQINSPLSKAPLFLLKNGARIATSTSDILEEMGRELKVDRKLPID